MRAKVQELVVLALVLFSPSTFAAIDSGENAKVSAFDSDGSIKLAAALFVSSSTDGYSFSFESPSFFSYSLHEGLLNDKIGVFLDYSSLRLHNFLSDEENGLLTDSFNQVFSLGLIRRSYLPNRFATYLKLAASLAQADRRLTSQRRDWGVKFGFGLEHLYHFRSFVDSEHLNQGSTFIEVSYAAHKLKADRLSGEPVLFNDISIALGFRAYY